MINFKVDPIKMGAKKKKRNNRSYKRMSQSVLDSNLTNDRHAMGQKILYKKLEESQNFILPNKARARDYC